MPLVAEDRNVAEELARHPRWRWAVGMALVWDAPSGRRHRSRVVTAGEDWGHCHIDSRLGFVPEGAVPDLEDDATAGVLLGMLWAADPDPEHGWHAHQWSGRGFVVHASESRPEVEGATFAAAVARALLIAWSSPGAR